MSWSAAYTQQRLLRASMAAGVAASLCGIISVSFCLLEATFLVSSLDVAEWRPLFVVWAVSFLAISWFLSYRLARAPLPDGPASPASKIPKWNKGILWIATIVVVISVTFPIVSPAIANALERRWPTTMSSNAMTVTIKVPSVDCVDCARRLDAVLRKQRGLEKAEISLEKKEATVWYNPAKTSKSVVLETLKLHHFTTEEAK